MPLRHRLKKPAGPGNPKDSFFLQKFFKIAPKIAVKARPCKGPLREFYTGK